jgi:hypothetical protein
MILLINEHGNFFPIYKTLQKAHLYLFADLFKKKVQSNIILT